MLSACRETARTPPTQHRTRNVRYPPRPARPPRAARRRPAAGPPPGGVVRAPGLPARAPPRSGTPRRYGRAVASPSRFILLMLLLTVACDTPRGGGQIAGHPRLAGDLQQVGDQFGVVLDSAAECATRSCGSVGMARSRARPANRREPAGEPGLAFRRDESTAGGLSAWPHDLPAGGKQSPHIM